MADKTATIEFDEYPGQAFIVRLSPVSLDDYLDLGERFDSLATAADIRGAMERFAEVALVGWEGVAGEANAENLRKQDYNLVLALFAQWSRAVARAPLPLPRTPGAGTPSKARRASASRSS